MSRLSSVIWMLVIVVAAFMLYMVKYRVQAVETQVAKLSRQLEAEKEALHVVAAEWAYLNRPARLRALAARYLAMSDLTVSQVADIDTIPLADRSVASADDGNGMQTVAVRLRRGAGAGQ